MRVWMPTIATNTGAQVYAELLAQGLTDRGFKVDFDLLPQKFQYAPWLARAAAHPKTDVTIANSWSASAFSGKSALVTIVHHVVHDPMLAPYKTRLQALYHRMMVLPMERAALRRSAKVIAVSHATKEGITRHLGDVPVQTIANGIDTKFFTPKASHKPHDSTRPVKLLFVGKPSRRKGIELVQQLIRQLGKRCQLTIVGPPAEQGIKLQGADILGKVSRDRLLQAYRNADFLVFPSRLEGFGYVAAEAMACGLPVICIAGGAVDEVVCPPTGGIALDPQAGVEDLAQEIMKLWSNPKKLATMRKTARERAVANFDYQRWLDDFEEMLVELDGAAR